MLRKLAFFLLLLIIYRPVQSQTPALSIHGIVRDSNTNQSLEDATVSLIRPTDGALLRRTRFAVEPSDITHPHHDWGNLFAASLCSRPFDLQWNSSLSF